MNIPTVCYYTHEVNVVSWFSVDVEQWVTAMMTPVMNDTVSEKTLDLLTLHVLGHHALCPVVELNREHINVPVFSSPSRPMCLFAYVVGAVKRQQHMQ